MNHFTAQDLKFTAQFPPVACRRARCKDGLVQTAGGPVDCASCVGRGTTIHLRDLPAAKRVEELRNEARRQFRAARKALPGHQEDAVYGAFVRLDSAEPERVAALYASVLNGRVDAVISALLAYAPPVAV
jgi:hypothetical protein